MDTEKGYKGVLWWQDSNTSIQLEDLKPSNLLVNANCDLKICDLGLAREGDASHNKSIYVVTRWYRAPELLLGNKNYGCPIDVWSSGAILGELYGRTPIFQGKDYLHMLRLIVDVCGAPKREEYQHICSSVRGSTFLSTLQNLPRTSWKAKYPSASSEALELLDKLLQVNPKRRLTSCEVLQHPFFRTLHDPEDEPASDARFDFGFDREHWTASRFRELVRQAASDIGTR